MLYKDERIKMGGKRGEFEMQRCCAIRESGLRKGEVCGSAGKVIIMGKTYCGVHNPERLKQVSENALSLRKSTIEKNENQFAFDKAVKNVIDTCKLWYKGGATGHDLNHDIREMLKAEDKL